MATSADLHERIIGQNLPKRFLANVERNGSVEVLNWKNSAGDWESKTLVEMAEDNRWGALRIQGALKYIGHPVSHQTVLNILKRHGVHPSPNRIADDS